MYIHAHYDPETSQMLEKMTFSCEKYELRREDLIDLAQRKILRLKGDDLPEIIPCELLIHFESFKEAKLIFYNPEFQLPAEVCEEPFLNKQLIDWCEKNGGFWMELMVPLNDGGITFTFEYAS